MRVLRNAGGKRTVMHRAGFRGLGDASTVAPQFARLSPVLGFLTTGPEQFGCPWWDPFTYTSSKCNAAPPAPMPPTVALTTTPTANSSYAGVDASGQNVYATPETAQENIDRYKASLGQFFQSFDVGDTIAPFDWTPILLVTAGLAAAAILSGDLKRRRR